MENDTNIGPVDQADKLYAAHHIREAKAAYEAIIADDPTHAWAYNRLGAIEAQEGNLDAAEELLKKAIELNPELPQAHSNLGNLNYTRGNYKEAEICYRAAIGIDPTNPLYHENLHAAYKKLNKYSEAVRSLKHANKLKNASSRQQASKDAARLTGRLKGRLGCVGSSVLVLTLAILLAVAIL